MGMTIMDFKWIIINLISQKFMDYNQFCGPECDYNRILLHFLAQK